MRSIFVVLSVAAASDVVLQNEHVVLTIDSNSLKLTSLKAAAGDAKNLIGTSALWSAQFVVGGVDGALTVDSSSAACARTFCFAVATSRRCVTKRTWSASRARQSTVR